MTKLISDYLWKLLLFTGACATLQYFMQAMVLTNYTFYLPVWKTYGFLTLITLLGYLLVLFVYQRDAEKTGMAFIAIGFFKMLAAVLFLYPLIVSETSGLLVQVLSFFIPYFFFLGFDTFFTIRLLLGKD